MATPYIGEIKIFGGNYAPVGWALCDGSLLSINDYSPLFTLIGTAYGGDGINTFALPDLRGRLPIDQGQGNGLSRRVLGQAGGSETVTLQTPELPSHNHIAVANSTAGNSNDPAGRYWSGSATVQQYVPGDQANTNMNPAAIANNGQSQPHTNLQPFLALNFIIALDGIFPTQN